MPLSPDQIASILKKADAPKATTGAVDRTGLTYCAFCKGYYNEYHFGEPEGGES